MAARMTMTPASSGEAEHVSRRLVEFVVMTRITKMRASGARRGRASPDAAARCLVERERRRALAARNHDEHVKEHASRGSTCTVASTRASPELRDGHGRDERRDEHVPRASDMSPA